VRLVKRLRKMGLPNAQGITPGASLEGYPWIEGGLLLKETINAKYAAAKGKSGLRAKWLKPNSCGGGSFEGRREEFSEDA